MKMENEAATNTAVEIDLPVERFARHLLLIQLQLSQSAHTGMLTYYGSSGDKLSGGVSEPSYISVFAKRNDCTNLWTIFAP